MADGLQSRIRPTTPTEGEAGRRALADDLARLAEGLAMGLVLAGDHPFRSWLRGQAGVGALEPLAVSLGQGRWAHLDGAATRFERSAPVSGPQLDVFARLAQDAGARQALEAAGRRLDARGQADRMLAGLLDRGADPTRGRMADLLAWSALVEHDAYRFSARCMAVLLDLRRHALAGADPAARPQLLTYWRLALANCHVSLLAATREARPWLVDMARSFTWADWTPTMPFLQERSLWFAAVGAQHAAAFGAEVIEPYLRTLAVGTQPLRVFDAAFGLTAIGLSEPGVIGALTQELDRQGRRFARQGGPHDAMHAAIVGGAMRCLADPEAAERAFQGVARSLGVPVAPRDALLTRPAAILDITTSVESVGYLGLLVLPSLVRRAAIDLYPTRSARVPASALGPAEIAAHIARGWTSGSAFRAQVH